MSSQLFCYEFFGTIYQDSYSTGCMCTAASGGYTPLRSFFRSISDDLFFQARLGCAVGGIALRGDVPVRGFLWGGPVFGHFSRSVIGAVFSLWAIISAQFYLQCTFRL